MFCRATILKSSQRGLPLMEEAPGVARANDAGKSSFTDEDLGRRRAAWLGPGIAMVSFT